MEISEIAIICQNHPTDDVLEEYCFGRLNEEQAAPVEEHLLVCAQCQSVLAQIDEYIHLFKAASVAPEPRRFWAFRPWVWGPALAMSCAAIFLALLPSVPSGAVPVTLASYRGSDPALLAHAPRSRPLDLSLNAADIPGAVSYRIQVVTAAG